jgi:cobalamin biosynthesis Mg chelatase CobN
MTSSIDYLTEDPVLSGQKYVCISILTAKSIKDNSGNSIESDNHAKGIKIRGVYDTMEEAQKRCQQIRTFDPYFNVFVGEVGKWLPWDDDAEKAEDAVYAESKLNDIMRGYKEQQRKAKEYNEYRKQMEIERAIKIAQSKEKDKQKQTETDPDTNVVVEDTKKEEVEEETKVLTPEEIAKKEQRVAQISKELEEAKRLFDELRAAQK